MRRGLDDGSAIYNAAWWSLCIGLAGFVGLWWFVASCLS